MIDWTDHPAPSAADIANLARAAFVGLPLAIQAAAGGVEIHVEEFAAEETLDGLGIEDPFELSGLYEGVDRLHQSVLDPTPHIARVFLFRRPILDEWAERGEVPLGEMIGHVLIHEIGHHMGLSDDDIAAIEAQAD